MKTTALIRIGHSSSHLLLTFENSTRQQLEQFYTQLRAENLLDPKPVANGQDIPTGSLHNNFSSLANKAVGFESRTQTPDELARLLNAIERYCHMYRISYRIEQLASITNEYDKAITSS